MSELTDSLQNRCNESVAISIIARMSDEDISEKMKELGKKGYEYNRGIDVLISLDTTIPYDFILYCLLVENSRQRKN